MAVNGAPAGNQGSGMQRFREGVAGAIALIVVVSTMLFMAVAFLATNSDEQFGRAKDLLLIINPVLGLVIGYYFTKASTEARAESAERTAQGAAAAANQAAEARQAAEVEARVAEQKAGAATADAQETRAVLAEVSHAAERVLDQPPAAPGTLGANGAGAGSDDARRNLQDALARARQRLGA